MKKIASILIAGCLAFSTTSCDKFLTETPTTSIPDDTAFDSAKDFQNAISGVYNTLGTSTFLGRDAMALPDAASDLIAHSGVTSHFYDIFNYQIQETNTYLEGIWEYGYAVIDRSARIIDAGTQPVLEMNESDKATVNQCVAQAYGTRALCTFLLTNIYALPYSEQNKNTLGIVNVEKQVKPFTQVQRVTVEENYRFILSDIEKAKEFYAKEGVKDEGYIKMNIAAVYALEARVKLYMANYAGAIAAAEKAIASRGGSIVSTPTEYKAMFTTLAISSEDIFVLAKSETDFLSSNSLNNLYSTTYGLSVNPQTIAEYEPTDIRLSMLGGESWSGGKMAGITSNNMIQNLPIFRLPEVYLTLAEAEAALGKYDLAKRNYLEVAAKRNPSLDTDAIKEDASLIPLIARERKLELVQEGHRFFDARRLNQRINVSNGLYKEFAVSGFAYPIPAKEVNSGFGVVQTTGWSSKLPK